MEDWSREAEEFASEADRLGVEVVYFTGGELRGWDGRGQPISARGLYVPERGNSRPYILVQADHETLSLRQIGDHELFHHILETNPKLAGQLMDELAGRFDWQELRRQADAYQGAFAGCYKPGETWQVGEGEEGLSYDIKILEEMLCDAYAKINDYGVTAGDSFHDIIRREAERRGGTEVAGEAQPRTPTETEGEARYSFEERHVPTYEELISKPDVPVIDIRTSSRVGFRQQRKDFNNSEGRKALLREPIQNKDTGELVFVTPDSFTHSFSNLGLEQIWAVRHLREIVENAVLTHAEPSRKAHFDQTTGIYTLFAAVRTDEGVVPVKIKVKEFRYTRQALPQNVQAWMDAHGETGQYASLYDSKVLVLEKIEKEEASSSALAPAKTGNAGDRHPSASSFISIEELLNLVKGEAGKYIPSSGGGQRAVKGESGSEARYSPTNVSVEAERKAYDLLTEIQLEVAEPQGDYWLETENQAGNFGWPKIDGKQVIPFSSWVAPRQGSGQGLVVGRRNDQLLVHFWNGSKLALSPAAVRPDMLRPIAQPYAHDGKGDGNLFRQAAEKEARAAGWPTLGGRQVMPFVTWVREGEKGRYGLARAVDKGPEGTRLEVLFWSKEKEYR